MQEYEITYEQKTINVRLIALIIVCGLIVAFMMYPMVTQKPKAIIKNTTENISTVIEIQYVTVLVTPTPDGKEYFVSEYQNGIRKIQRPFSFIREDASGLKDLKVTTTVYDYKAFNKLHWHNDADNKDYLQYPNEGYRYLFVMFNMQADDRIADDSRFFMPNSSNFIVYDELTGEAFYPKEYPEQLYFLELENTYNLNDDSKVKAYGQSVLYTDSLSAKSTGGYISDKHNILRGGRSNSEDGYKIYEIPNTIKDENLIVGINFYSWGDAFWRLKP